MAKPSGRKAILDTAERLFAEHGMEAVSLRSINTQAGYSVAALHYHFGSREGLIDALIERGQGSMLSHREALLEALDAEGETDIHRIVDALVLPFAEPILCDPERGLRTIKFFYRVYMEQGERGRIRAITQQSYRIFDRLLASALPHIGPDVLHQRWVIATELAFQGLANIEYILAGRSDDSLTSDYKRYTGQLVDFIAGGLAASVRNG